MLKQKLKNLNNNSKSLSKSIEVINDKDLQSIKGGKLATCPKLTSCGRNYDDCPNLVSCGTNYTE